jgi:hypothetical protein
MKTLRIFALLCIIALLSATNAFSQRTSGSYDWIFTLTPTDCECLSEVISGTVTIEWSSAGNTWHEKAWGILTNENVDEEYTLDYEANMQFIFRNVTIIGWTWPMLLRHDGKLFAVIHESSRYVELPENSTSGPVIVDRFIRRVDCK